MIRYFVFCVIISQVIACNKQCGKKEDEEDVMKNAADEKQILGEIVAIINDVCKQGAENGLSMCNHTATLPPNVFTESPINVTLKYTDIELVKRENELHQNKGLVTASILYIYRNLSVTLTGDDFKVTINSKSNLFEITFTLKLPGVNQDEQCFFEWNNIQVMKFEVESTSSDGPSEKTAPIVAVFGKKEALQNILNDKPFKDFINKEMSVCNKESFLHDITSAFILIVALKGFGSMIGNLFNDIFC